MRRLIVNADDFGLSDGVNRGVAHAHEHGIVTATSLMVHQPAAAAAAEYARLHPRLDVGLHVDLGEWFFDGHQWQSVYTRVDVRDATAVAREVRLQMAMFEELVGRVPTHLDSHQHVHQREPVRSIMTSWADQLGVPLRHVSPEIRYEGSFYGQNDEGEPLLDQISNEYLISILTGLEVGVTEICCHPALGADLKTMYAAERAVETRTLCDPSVRSAVEALGLELFTFSELTR